MENWQEIKQYVYHEDGSLRDIYVNVTTLEDWRKWIDFVNQKYIIHLRKISSTEVIATSLSFKDIEEYFFWK